MFLTHCLLKKVYVYALLVFSLVAVGADNNAHFAQQSHTKNTKDLQQKLKSALASKNRQQLYEIKIAIEQIWRGDKSNSQAWRIKRDERITSLLMALDTIITHVNWDIDNNTPIEQTLSPPLDYNIMQYTNGFGLSLIEDKMLKEKIRKDLKRVNVARENRSFQNLIKYRYEQWLDSFISLINNFYFNIEYESNQQNASLLLNQIINKSIKQQDLIACLKRLVFINEKIGKNKLRAMLKENKGNCSMILQLPFP